MNKLLIFAVLALFGLASAEMALHDHIGCVVAPVVVAWLLLALGIVRLYRRSGK